MNPNVRLSSSSVSPLLPKKPLAATQKFAATSAPRTEARRPRSASRLLLQAAAAGVALVVFALLGTGTSYALWNGRAQTNASTVTAGTTSIAINGVANYAIPSLNSSKIGPGQSAFVPLTITNTGSTPVSAIVATTASTANALTNELSIRVTASGTCSAGLAGGTIGRMATFSTASTPALMAAGSSLTVCLEVVMDLDAPVTTANLASDFTLTVTATQVRSA